MSPVVIVLSDSGREGERGRDIEESGVPDMEVMVTEVAFSRSGLSFDAVSERQASPLEWEQEHDEDHERKP